MDGVPDESHQELQEGEPLRLVRKSLRVLEVHAAHRKRLQVARDKLSAGVDALLKRLGAPPPGDGEWPALASAASIVSGLSPSLQDSVLARLPEDIREQMIQRLYAFASIPRQTSRAIQKLIHAVNQRTLAVALIGAEKEIQEAVLANMSKRAATMLNEDIASLVNAGDLSTRDVREARTAVGTAMYELYESGELGGHLDG